MKNAKTLQFDSDFDFESANAQFKNDLTKEGVGMCTIKVPYSFNRRPLMLIHSVLFS